MERFWFKLTRIDKYGNLLQKSDFCYIDANNSNEAYNIISDKLWKDKKLLCNYFTKYSSYPRSIQDIANFEIVEESYVSQFIDRCFYMEAKKTKPTV